MISRVQFLYIDRDESGLIDADNERNDPDVSYFPYVGCDLSVAPHTNEPYLLQVDMNDGASLNKTITPPTPLAVDQLTPLSGLTGSWNNTENELQISWTLPVVYPAGTKVEIRLEPYNNGQNKNIRIRIKDLPSSLITFTLDSSMTTPFNNSSYDQFRLELRLRGIDNTNAVTRQGFDFDYQGGTLTPATIRQRPLDVNNGGVTGYQRLLRYFETR